MQSNYDDMLTPILMTISTFRCLMQVNTNMKKAKTHFFLWTSFTLYDSTNQVSPDNTESWDRSLERGSIGTIFRVTFEIKLER